MSGVYPRLLEGLLTGQVNIGTTNIGCLLVGSGFTWNEAHRFVSDISGEVSDASYSRQTGTGTISQNLTDNKMVLDMPDPVFGSLNNVSPVAAVFYVDAAGADSAKRLISVIDTNNLSTNGSDVTVQIPTDGIMHLTYSEVTVS